MRTELNLVGFDESICHFCYVEMLAVHEDACTIAEIMEPSIEGSATSLILSIMADADSPIRLMCVVMV